MLRSKKLANVNARLDAVSQDTNMRITEAMGCNTEVKTDQSDVFRLTMEEIYAEFNVQSRAWCMNDQRDGEDMSESSQTQVVRPVDAPILKTTAMMSLILDSLLQRR